MTITGVIPSYLYQEYADDDDLQGFVSAQNALSQSYLDWFNETGLPIYTGLSGSLLDWVAEGLYGLSRPILPELFAGIIGPLNTWALNTVPLNFATSSLELFGAIGFFIIGVSPIEDSRGGVLPTYLEANDDIFKRVITWNFFKGDGNVFNVRWLKRRVERFLDGVDGVDPGISTTYDVRVIFGIGTLVNIILVGPLTIRSAVLNTFALNTMPLNGVLPTYLLDRGATLRAGILAGILQLPFQYRYAVYG